MSDEELQPGKRRPAYRLNEKTLKGESQEDENPRENQSSGKKKVKSQNSGKAKQGKTFFSNSTVNYSTLFAELMKKDPASIRNPSQEDKNRPLFGINSSTPKDPISFLSIKEGENLFTKEFPRDGILFTRKKDQKPPLSEKVSDQNVDQQEQADDSKDLQEKQKMKIDPSKSTGKYVYEVQTKTILSKTLQKYKKNNGGLIQGVQVSIQSDKEGEKFWLLVRIQATKRVIFTGLLLKGASLVRIIGSKPENLQITLFAKKDDKTDSSVAYQRVTTKMQFESQEDGRAFQTAVQQII